MCDFPFCLKPDHECGPIELELREAALAGSDVLDLLRLAYRPELGCTALRGAFMLAGAFGLQVVVMREIPCWLGYGEGCMASGAARMDDDAMRAHIEPHIARWINYRRSHMPGN